MLSNVPYGHHQTSQSKPHILTARMVGLSNCKSHVPELATGREETCAPL